MNKNVNQTALFQDKHFRDGTYYSETSLSDPSKKKRDMYKLALFSLQKSTQKRGTSMYVLMNLTLPIMLATRGIKPEKVFSKGWNTGFIYHGYCQEDPFWKQTSILSFRVS